MKVTDLFLQHTLMHCGCNHADLLCPDFRVFSLGRVTFSSLCPLKPFSMGTKPFSYVSIEQLGNFFILVQTPEKFTEYFVSAHCDLHCHQQLFYHFCSSSAHKSDDIFQIKKFFKVSCVVGRLHNMSVVISEIPFCFLSVALIFYIILAHLGFTPTDTGKKELM